MYVLLLANSSDSQLYHRAFLLFNLELYSLVDLKDMRKNTRFVPSRLKANIVTHTGHQRFTIIMKYQHSTITCQPQTKQSVNALERL